MVSPPPTTPSTSTLKVIPVTPADLDTLINLQFHASAHDEFHNAIWGANTPANQRAAKDRLLSKWQDHKETMHIVQCVDTTTDTNHPTPLAWCIWEMVPPMSTRAEAVKEDAMNTCDWLEGHERKIARAYLIDSLYERWNVLKGKPHAHLTNLCTRADARRRGAATALVQWGLGKANEAGVPAYCEVSDMSHALYLRLGFKDVSTVKAMLDGELFSTCPVVMKEPDTIQK